jgi:hypothetical protein
MVVARAILAAILLLTLVGGSIVWPAAASGPMCTLACCAGRAPHLAGSCMDASCHAGVATQNPASPNSHQAHHHQEQPAEESADVPTIEADSSEPYADNREQDGHTDKTEVASNRSRVPGIQATVFSKPCRPECGACASGFASPKRARNAAALAVFHQSKPQSPVRFARGRHHVTYTRAALGRQSIPRGPPLSSLSKSNHS